MEDMRKRDCYGGFWTTDVQWKLVALKDSLPSSLGKQLSKIGGELYELTLTGLTAEEIKLIGKTLHESGTK